MRKKGLILQLFYTVCFVVLMIIMVPRIKSKSEAGDEPLFLVIFVMICLLVLVILMVINLKKRCINPLMTMAIQSGEGKDGKEGEITTNYTDAAVLSYFNNEQKSGCFGSKPKYTDKNYDDILLKWINENATKSCALRRIGVDETQVNEIEPICFQGFESDSGFMGRYGLDGKFRTTQYSVTWLFFSDSQIFVFNIFFDLLYHKTKIITYEYFYRDITNFSSIFSSYEYEKLTEIKGCMKNGVNKELKKIETQKFSIVVPGDSFSCSVSGVAKIDEIIQGLKQKLREKKEERA